MRSTRSITYSNAALRKVNYYFYRDQVQCSSNGQNIMHLSKARSLSPIVLPWISACDGEDEVREKKNIVEMYELMRFVL